MIVEASNPRWKACAERPSNYSKAEPLASVLLQHAWDVLWTPAMLARERLLELKGPPCCEEQPLNK